MCEKETGCNRGGGLRDHWWRQIVPRSQLRDTIEKNSSTDRAQRQESITDSKSGGWEKEVYISGRQGLRGR